MIFVFCQFVNSKSVEDKVHSERTGPFYNWLNECDSRPQTIQYVWMLDNIKKSNPIESNLR